MFKTIKRSFGLTIIAAAVVSGGWMMGTTSASASELYDLVVIPADDDWVPQATLAIAPIAAPARPQAQRASSSTRIAPNPARSAERPTQTRIAWPYTARTFVRK